MSTTLNIVYAAKRTLRCAGEAWAAHNGLPTFAEARQILREHGWTDGQIAWYENR